MPENSNIQEVENKSRVEQLLAAWAGGETIELWEPQSNIERILMNILGAAGVDINPIQSRNEALLLQILENGGGSGGGGDSDLSIATLTIIDPDELLESFYAPLIFDNEADYMFEDDPSQGIPIILYKGKARLDIDAPGATITKSGDIIVENHKYYITGNGTITITAGN